MPNTTYVVLLDSPYSQAELEALFHRTLVQARLATNVVVEVADVQGDVPTPKSKEEADAIEAAGGSPSSLTWPPRPNPGAKPETE